VSLKRGKPPREQRPPTRRSSRVSFVQRFERNVTNQVTHQALKLIARVKLTLDERVVLHCVNCAPRQRENVFNWITLSKSDHSHNTASTFSRQDPKPYPESSRADSYPWSPFPSRRARPGPGPHNHHNHHSHHITTSPHHHTIAATS
jgi:hypothetical protein